MTGSDCMGLMLECILVDDYSHDCVMDEHVRMHTACVLWTTLGAWTKRGFGGFCDCFSEYSQ